MSHVSSLRTRQCCAATMVPINGTHRIVISILDFKEVVMLAVAHLPDDFTLLNHHTRQPLLAYLQ
jgi:hypothetical protein